MSETMRVPIRTEERYKFCFANHITNRGVTRNNVRHEITIMIYAKLSSSCIITVAARVIALHHIVSAAHCIL